MISSVLEVVTDGSADVDIDIRNDPCPVSGVSRPPLFARMSGTLFR